jgi:hypothetical protein
VIIFALQFVLLLAEADAVSNKPNLVFDGGFSPKEKAAIHEITNAIRSGNAERVKAYSGKGEDAKGIIQFWGSVSDVNKLIFKARKWRNGIILQDAEIGMSSCDLIKNGDRYYIGNCTFNDGN